MSAAEEKIDPYDGKARTLAELTRMTQGAWGQEQVLKYWETQCKPVPVDPYMSHLQVEKSSSLSASRNLGPELAAYPPASEQQSPTRPASQVALDDPGVPPGPFSLGQDPFMTQGAAKRTAEGVQAARDDVDAQGAAQAVAARELLEQQVPPQQLPQKHWKESMFAALGPGDQDRQPKARSILLTVPILMFIWEIIVFTLLQHISANACWLMTSILVVISAASIAMWTLGIRWGPVSLLALWRPLPSGRVHGRLPGRTRLGALLARILVGQHRAAEHADNCIHASRRTQRCCHLVLPRCGGNDKPHLRGRCPLCRLQGHRPLLCCTHPEP